MTNPNEEQTMTGYYTFRFRPQGAFTNRFQEYEATSESEARERFQAEYPGATESGCTFSATRRQQPTFTGGSPRGGTAWQ